MSTQAVVPYFTQVILSHRNATGVTDAFAIVHFFGNTFETAAQVAEVKRLGLDGLFAWLNGPANPILEYGSLGEVDAAVEAQLRVLRPLGIPLLSYEGGQHLLAGGSMRGDLQLESILDRVNRAPRMRSVYLKYLASWHNRTGQPLQHYVHCDRWSVYGKWGAEEYASQPRARAPKLDALLAFIASSPL
ncbi:hypothetical protein ABPG75_003957 [Micractinium tetrahymenae]